MTPAPVLMALPARIGLRWTPVSSGWSARGDTLLTGVLDRSALYGVLAEIEALNLDLVELLRLVPRRT
jgi:hypothetical protein